VPEDAARLSVYHTHVNLLFVTRDRSSLRAPKGVFRKHFLKRESCRCTHIQHVHVIHIHGIRMHTSHTQTITNTHAFNTQRTKLKSRLKTNLEVCMCSTAHTKDSTTTWMRRHCDTHLCAHPHPQRRHDDQVKCCLPGFCLRALQFGCKRGRRQQTHRRHFDFPRLDPRSLERV
jgi:hypothetical protein